MKPHLWKVYVSAVFVLFALVAFWVSRDYPLVYDDRAVLEDNSFVAAADYSSIWTTGYWSGIRRLGTAENLYRPLFLSSVAALRSHPGVLRFFVAIGHALTALLLIALVLRFRESQSPSETFSAFDLGAVLAASLFLLHPAQVEVFVQIVGFMDVVSLLLGLGAFLLATRHPWMAVALAALAPGWKETGLLAPGLLVVYFLSETYLFRARPRNWILPSLTLTLSMMVWLALRNQALGSFFTFAKMPYSLLNPIVDMNGWDAFWSRLTLIGYHLRLFLLPFPLSSDYSRGTLPVPGYPLQVFVLLAIAGLVGLALGAKHLRKAATTASVRAAIFGMIFAAASVLPTLHLTGPIGILFAERFGYGLRAALCLGLGLGMTSFWKHIQRKHRPLALAFATILLLLSGGLFLARVDDWRSGRALFTRDLEHFPFNAKLQFNLGMAYGGTSAWSDALRHFQRALELAPDFPEAHFRIGLVYREMGQEERAQEHWRIAEALGYSIPKRE